MKQGMTVTLTRNSPLWQPPPPHHQHAHAHPHARHCHSHREANNSMSSMDSWLTYADEQPHPPQPSSFHPPPRDISSYRSRTPPPPIDYVSAIRSRTPPPTDCPTAPRGRTRERTRERTRTRTRNGMSILASSSPEIRALCKDVILTAPLPIASPASSRHARRDTVDSAYSAASTVSDMTLHGELSQCWMPPVPSPPPSPLPLSEQFNQHYPSIRSLTVEDSKDNVAILDEPSHKIPYGLFQTSHNKSSSSSSSILDTALLESSSMGCTTTHNPYVQSGSSSSSSPCLEHHPSYPSPEFDELDKLSRSLSKIRLYQSPQAKHCLCKSPTRPSLHRRSSGDVLPSMQEIIDDASSRPSAMRHRRNTTHIALW